MKRFTLQLQRARFYMYWRFESDRLTFAASCGQYGFNGETLAASDLLADLTCPHSLRPIWWCAVAALSIG